MNKIKELEQQIKKLQEEKSKLEKEDQDEKIKVGMEYFYKSLAEFSQRHYSIDESKKKLYEETEELSKELSDILKSALEKQWKHFEDQKNEKCNHMSFWKAVIEVMMGRKIKD